VYDITRKETFVHVKNWLDEVKMNGNPHMEILLVGNKNDLEEERVVSYEEGEKIAKENGLKFIEINSKEYGKVESAFKKVSEAILHKV
jgi:Ras-related protein Rab-2A